MRWETLLSNLQWRRRRSDDPVRVFTPSNIPSTSTETTSIREGFASIKPSNSTKRILYRSLFFLVQQIPNFISHDVGPCSITRSWKLPLYRLLPSLFYPVSNYNTNARTNTFRTPTAATNDSNRRENGFSEIETRYFLFDSRSTNIGFYSK